MVLLVAGPGQFILMVCIDMVVWRAGKNRHSDLLHKHKLVHRYLSIHRFRIGTALERIGVATLSPNSEILSLEH
jgi:hypothetical protein